MVYYSQKNWFKKDVLEAERLLNEVELLWMIWKLKVLKSI